MKTIEILLKILIPFSIIILFNFGIIKFFIFLGILIFLTIFSILLYVIFRKVPAHNEKKFEKGKNNKVKDINLSQEFFYLPFEIEPNLNAFLYY